jgi:hypothetical protein
VTFKVDFERRAFLVYSYAPGRVLTAIIHTRNLTEFLKQTNNTNLLTVMDTHNIVVIVITYNVEQKLNKYISSLAIHILYPYY